MEKMTKFHIRNAHNTMKYGECTSPNQMTKKTKIMILVIE